MATRAERKAEAEQRAAAVLDAQIREREDAQAEALEACKLAFKESKRARREFVRELFKAYGTGLSYNRLADGIGMNVAGVFNLMQRHGADGKLLTPEKRGREDLRPVGGNAVQGRPRKRNPNRKR